MKHLSKQSATLILALAGLLLSLLPWSLNGFRDFEAATWDWRVRSLADPKEASDDICLILLDQASLDWAQKESEITWPWPREIFSTIVDFCHQSQAKSVAFDVLFTEPAHLEGDDEILSMAMKQSTNFVLATQLSQSSGTDALLQELNQPHLETADSHLIQTFPKANLPIPEFLANARILAHVNSSTDADGINRRVTPLFQFSGETLPILGLGAYLAANPQATLSLKNNNLYVGEHRLPLDNKGAAHIRFHGPAGTYPTYSAAAIIQSYLRLQDGEKPVVNLDELKDKHVFFGFSAPALYDLHNSPFGGKYPGVELHATFLDNLINDDFLTPVPTVINVLLAFLLVISCSFLMLRFSSSKSQLLTASLLLLLTVGLSYMTAKMGYHMALVMPFIAVISTIFFSLIFNYMTEGRQKRFIKHAFRHYLSPHVIDELIHQPDKLKLGGERSEISIFFSDLEGFTTISERMSPEDLIAVLNEYLSAMSNIILDDQGTIDKYEGDAIIAFWNAPVKVQNHAKNAVRAALSCQQALAAMRDELMTKTGSPLKMRIGIHTGPAVVGNMGAQERFDYTMLGDSVNLAARLEGVNKQFGTYTLISEETKNQMDGAYPVRELGKVAVVGRKEAVRIFEPMLSGEYDTRRDSLDNFSKALQLFYQDDVAAALKIFSRYADADPAAQAYAEKCQTIIDSGAASQNGVWVMSSK